MRMRANITTLFVWPFFMFMCLVLIFVPGKAQATSYIWSTATMDLSITWSEGLIVNWNGIIDPNGMEYQLSERVELGPEPEFYWSPGWEILCDFSVEGSGYINIVADYYVDVDVKTNSLGDFAAIADITMVFHVYDNTGDGIIMGGLYNPVESIGVSDGNEYSYSGGGSEYCSAFFEDGSSGSFGAGILTGFGVSSSVQDIIPVCEPSTMFLVFSGLIGVASFRKKFTRY